MKGFYSPIDQLAAQLPRTKGTGAEFMTELSKRPGYKPQEAQDRDLQTLMALPKMERAQFLDSLKSKPAPQLNETVLTDNDNTYDDDNIAKYGQYTLPGGNNYREILLRMPYDEQRAKEFKDPASGHWDHANVLAHVRAKDRKGPNGEKLLHIEEIQSDWHQKGRDKGYLSPDMPKQIAAAKLAHQKLKHQLEEARSYSDSYERKLKSDMPLYQDPEVRQRTQDAMNQRNNDIMDLMPQVMKAEAAHQDLLAKSEQGVPDAPFKKNWHELALKKMIHHAAEKGYHGIVITPGEEQADRYSLAKHADRIAWQKQPDGTFSIQAIRGNDDDSNEVLSKDKLSGEQLAELIGKDAASKINENSNKSQTGTLSGLDLKVGGEGMKGFYDKIIPSFLNQFGKKYGAQVRPGFVSIVSTPAQHHGLTESQFQAQSPDEQQRMVRQHAYAHQGAKTEVPVHHFPITPEMREDVVKNGVPLYSDGGIINKAEGGNVQPTVAQMRMALSKQGNPIDLKSMGINEAPDMPVKHYYPPDDGFKGPSPGGVAMRNGMPIGGIDQNRQQPGQQMMPMQPQQAAPGQPPGAPGAQPPGGPPAGPQGPTPPMGNMLQMTPQGQTMAALGGAPKPPGSPGMAKGGQPSIEGMKAELKAKKNKSLPTRIKFDAEGSNGVKGIVVPRHMWEGSEGVFSKGDRKGQTFKNEGMRDINAARAQVYGSENRDPLTIGKIGSIHQATLNEHFNKPIEEQHEAEQQALNKLRMAKHLKKDADTLDESEKLDTVRHEHDEQGRTHVGFASKGVAGHSLYTSGHGENMKHHVINTCPGQTVGCGGGTDKNGIVDTSKGTCFAPNAEQQYVNASIRRSAHEQAKHDPAMTRDWILAHTASLRNAARLADRNNQRLLFRPNVVDETDVSSRHVIRHLNEQRKEEGKPPIIANSYGKTGELHDPENGYYVTHSNVGPKVKKGQEIAENVGRDKARVQNTITATDNKGDFTNEQGHKTPPKGSYMVTDVKRGSPMSKRMEDTITHAKYWSRGNEYSRLSAKEREEGPEGHFGPNGKPTTPEQAHYGHITLNDKEGTPLRFDYQKQHILHPRLVNVPERKKNKKTGKMETVDHMIPTDSRFKDTEFLPKNRFMTKNGKEAGHILMTTPTESTSNIGHQTSFTHHVGPSHIEHAEKNNGEYEIDKPEDQLKAAGKEYVAPQAIKFYAEGGMVGDRHPGFSDDDFHAFPEQNVVAQRHLAMRRGADEPRSSHNASRSPVGLHSNTDTMRLALIMKKAK